MEKDSKSAINRSQICFAVVLRGRKGDREIEEDEGEIDCWEKICVERTQRQKAYEKKVTSIVGEL